MVAPISLRSINNVDRIDISHIGVVSNIGGIVKNRETAFDTVCHLLQENVGRPVKQVIAQIPAVDYVKK